MIGLRSNSMSKTVLFALVVVMCLALAGCSGSSTQSSAASASASGSSSSSQASANQASSEQSSAGLTFGEKTPTALSLVVKNETGADISALSALPASGEGEPIAITKEGESLAAGQQATVYVEPMGDNRYIFMFLVGADVRQLHNVDVPLLKEIAIRVEGDVAYLTAQIDGNLVSTLQEEYDIVHPPEVQEEQYEEPVYYEETVYYYEEAPAQTEDSCVSDIVLN